MAHHYPSSPSVAAGATVLITGAAHGMGALYARQAARRGSAAIALWDIDSDAASALAAELEGKGTRVRAFTVDLSDPEEIEAGIGRTRAEVGAPNILINNAGIVQGGAFWEQDPAGGIESIMRINSLAPMLLTRDFLPDMMSDRSRPQRILNIASAAGTLANPNMSVYAASKWAMVGWSDSVRLELIRNGYGHISVTTFCPSYVSTGMFAGTTGPLLTPIMTPVKAAAAAWKGMEEGRPFVMKPWTVRAGMAARGALPVRAWDVIADKVLRVYSSMDHFTGRVTRA